MQFLQRYFSFIIVLLIVGSNFCQSGSGKLLVIMIDAFRWDYYEMFKENMPALTEFISDGVQAKWVEPIFPSETFPSVTTIATGVFPENHGILANYLMNRSSISEDEMYMNRKVAQKPHQWIQVEPIWITTTKHNKKTFVMKWPLALIPYEGMMPAKYIVFNENTTFEEELDIALNVLTEDYSFVMHYYSDIDNWGHETGPYPDSLQLQESIIKFDGALQKFLLKLQDSSIARQLNVIILSDHGLTKTGINSGIIQVNLSNYVNLDYIDKIVNKKFILFIAAAENCVEKLFDQLKNIPGVDAYRKEEIPEELHHKSSPLVLDILLVARPGYIVKLCPPSDKYIPADGKSCLNPPVEGNHGYASLTDMRGVFYARGPAFKKGYIHSSIRLEDEYQIFAKILGVPALLHNGSWSRVAPMFANI